jgi:predicted MFS family arabinose efflux permease
LSGTAEEDRRAVFEIAIVIGVAMGAIVGAVLVATSLPWTTVLVAGAVLYVLAVLVIALVAG